MVPAANPCDALHGNEYPTLMFLWLGLWRSMTIIEKNRPNANQYPPKGGGMFPGLEILFAGVSLLP